MTTKRPKVATDELIVHEATLPNGLRIVALPRPASHRAVVTMCLRVGSRFEDESTNGLSHFLEHMLFRGTRSLASAHAQALAFERLGGTLYAATQSDHGTLSVSVPPESLAEVTRLFGEVVLAPRFSAIEVERGIVREEILEDLDDEGVQVDPDNLARELLYGDHPLGYTITGSVEQVARFDRAALTAHHARHYNASNCVLAFSGAIDPAQAERLARRHFGAMPRGARVEAGPPGHVRRKPRFRYVENLSSQTDLRVAFRAVADRAPDEPAAEMLLRVLDDGMSTRLYRRICDERGLCYDVSALFESYEDDGVFDVAAEVQHARAGEVLREVLSLVSDLAARGPSRAELDKARARHGWQMRAMLDDAEALAGWHALAGLADLPRSPAERHAQLEAVTRAEVRDVAAKIFRPAGLAAVAVGVLEPARRREIERAVARFGG